MEKNQSRNETVDLIKAIGIIGIIIGHSAGILPISHIKITSFVYLYHLMIFFFASGFCYNEIKYQNNPALYIGRKAYNLIPKFFIYNLIFVLLHNSLNSLALLYNRSTYSYPEMLIHIADGITFSAGEMMLGTFWFIPVLFFASLIFGFIFYYAYHFSTIRKKKNDLYLFLILCCLLCAAIGLYIAHLNVHLSYHLQTAFLAVPIFLFGWITKKHYTHINKYFNWLGCIIAAIILYCYVLLGGQIELASNITGDFFFYPITLLGIYFCLCLADIMMRLPQKIKKLFLFIGRNSFHYMALHFVTFKLTDLVIATFRHDSVDILLSFPHSYQLGLTYTVISLTLITLLLILYEKIKKEIKHAYFKHFHTNEAF